MDAAWMLMKLLASQQAIDILQAVESIRDYTDTFSFRAAETHRRVASVTAEEAADVAAVSGAFARPLDFRLRLMRLCGLSFFGYNAEITSRLGYSLRSLLPDANKALIATAYGHEGCVTDTVNDSYHGKMRFHSFVRSAEETQAAFEDGLKELVRRCTED